MLAESAISPDEHLFEAFFDGPNIERCKNKWNDPAVPKTGWRRHEIYDLGAVEAICEMCGEKEIRYIHVMKHPDWPKALSTGCRCASNLCGDMESERKEDTRLQNLAKKRTKRIEAWLDSGWHLSPRRNQQRYILGYRIVIWRRFKSWWFSIYAGTALHSPHGYPSERSAKYVALAVVMPALEERARRSPKRISEIDLVIIGLPDIERKGTS